jgi:tRNA 2-thiouridine synthesizing protein A
LAERAGREERDMSDTIDARGLACPQPVLLTRRALQADCPDCLRVLVDTEIQVHNCTRAAQKLGWQVESAPQDAGFELVLRKNDSHD